MGCAQHNAEKQIASATPITVFGLEKEGVEKNSSDMPRDYFRIALPASARRVARVELANRSRHKAALSLPALRENVS